MTLSTLIVIHEPTDVAALHSWINVELLKAPFVRVYPDGTGNEPGQGLDAWLLIQHGPLEPGTGGDDRPAGSVMLDFDTAYGYRGPMGETCSMLHASYIVRLVTAWCAPRGLTLSWRNEYDGTWHQGTEGLAGLIGDGDAANAWFTGVVQPILSAEAAASGAEIIWEG